MKTRPHWPRATALALFILARPAWALGLGELEVRSALGQPFEARIALLDAPAELDPDCFHLDSAQLVDARLSVARTPGGATSLVVRGRGLFDSPFAELRLTHGCAVTLTRDYVALIDPPPVKAEPESGAAGATPAPPPISLAPQALPEARPAAPPRAHSGAQRPPGRAAPARAHGPRLVLSTEPGSAAPTAGRAGLAEAEAQVAARNAVLDERLVTLENQAGTLTARLAALRTRNAELDARLAEARSQPQAAPPDWTLALLALLLLGLGAGVAALLGRTRAQVARPASADTWLADPALDATLTRPFAEPVATGFVPPDPPASPVLHEDILDQTEVCLAMGERALAIKLLEDHLRAHPNESPVPWLLLLDLRREGDDEDAYLAALRECKRRFNIDLEETTLPDPRGIEVYPHIVTQLQHLWPQSAKLQDFINRLLYDDRGGLRHGFSRPAYQDLLDLRELALHRDTPAPG